MDHVQSLLPLRHKERAPERETWGIWKGNRHKRQVSNEEQYDGTLWIKEVIKKRAIWAETAACMNTLLSVESLITKRSPLWGQTNVSNSKLPLAGSKALTLKTIQHHVSIQHSYLIHHLKKAKIAQWNLFNLASSPTPLPEDPEAFYWVKYYVVDICSSIHLT